MNNSPYLLDDCIYNILEHLQDDYSTLFNCLLVNRFWCKETVPLLYADPFEYLIDYVDVTTTTQYTIIFTLILCFDKVEILRLIDLLNKSNINVNNTYINDENEPLFEYSKYLKNYNCLTVNNIIIECFRNYLTIPSNHEIVKNFIPIFHQSNLNKNNNIKQFGISLYSFYNQNYNIQNFTQNLTKLNSLNLQDVNVTFNTLAQEFLKSMSNTCLNLRKFEICSLLKSKEIKENLCAIIQNQNKLKAFKISQCGSLLNDILSSLEFQKHSLVYIEFEDINFRNISFENFITLYNLKYLNFTNCQLLSIDQCDILNFASFKLKELTLITNNWNNDVTHSLIKYLGDPLQKLYFFGSLTISFIVCLSTFCLNLNSLKISISPDIDYSIYSYFKNLRTNNLILLINNRNYHLRNVTAKMMSQLARNYILNNIKEITIHYFYYNFRDTKLLGTFLENCHHNLETINLDISINSEDLKMILNNIEKNNISLKFLGMKKLGKVLEDEEMKLLDQIKARGVTLVNFSTIHHEHSPLTYYSI
ncbi:hypothetical protein RhiirA4_464201 [Rhizophagus irregularis]|uniref:F-box domain-containing protein n=1 Tax=Rhizophagus irregularis TaxID=588596 RepID=A0A2I1GPM1_9GLOM|nr:hypothetical protein RhiirA4_464201 [Rhizophagus irregularis]